MLNVVIVGGGLGGVGTAIGLARSGHRVTVLEAQKPFSQVSRLPRNYLELNSKLIS